MAASQNTRQFPKKESHVSTKPAPTSDKSYLLLRIGRAKAETKPGNSKVERLKIRPVKIRPDFNGFSAIVAPDKYSPNFSPAAICLKSSRGKKVFGQAVSWNWTVSKLQFYGTAWAGSMPAANPKASWIVVPVKKMARNEASRAGKSALNSKIKTWKISAER
jgi:hypothetical protein